MRLRSWEVISVDIEKKYFPDIVADLLNHPLKKNYFDLIWCSPPCTEFSRCGLPWIQSSNKPSTALVRSSKKIIEEFNPRFWVIENVKSSIPFIKPILGAYNFCINPYYFWTNVPQLKKIPFKYLPGKSKNIYRAADRAKIPFNISLQFCLSIEQYLF